MTKIVYNNTFGGFSLNEKAIVYGREISGNSEWPKPKSSWDVSRTDPILVKIVEDLADPSGTYGDLKIREIPAGTKYYIEEYDGAETVVTEDEHTWHIA